MAEKQKILVADDEPEIREVLRMMLSSEGYEITEACNAQEAVEKASGKDLVILDIMMPGESGIAACTKIREKNNVPILFLQRHIRSICPMRLNCMRLTIW